MSPAGNAEPRGVPWTDAGLRAALLAALAIGMSAVAYRPVLGVSFFADDLVCLFNIVNRGVVRFLVEPFGGHLLFVRNAVFWVSYLLFGFEAAPYYGVVFLTHLVNVWLFFRVARRLTGSAVLASLAAAMWGTSPLGMGTLGWYSVYGQVLVATIVLFLLDRVTNRAERPAQVPGRVAVGWYLLLLAGVACFGTGIGVALAFPAMLFLLLPEAFQQRGIRLAFLSLLVVVPAIYFGFRRLYPLFLPTPWSEIILANASLSRYWPIALMIWHLVAFSITGLVQGAFFVPNDYPGRASDVAASLYLALLLVVLVASDWATRRRLLALASLCVGVYALIAMGRSNFFLLVHIEPAASARLLRYHYVGAIPLAMALAVMLGQVARWTGGRSLLPAAALATWVVVIGQTVVRNGLPIEQHAHVGQWVRSSQYALVAKIEAERPGGLVQIENTPAPPWVLGPFLHHADFPGLAGVFVLTYPSNVVGGRRVEFVEREPAVLEMAEDPAANRRLAGLLVPPAAHPVAAPRP